MGPHGAVAPGRAGGALLRPPAPPLVLHWRPSGEGATAGTGLQEVTRL